ERWVLIYSFSYGYVCTQERSDWVPNLVIFKLNRAALYVGGSQKDRNEKIFYKLLIDNVEELLPIVYTPTVREAYHKYESIFRRPQDVDDCDLLIHFYVDAHGDICKDHNKKAQGCQPFRVTRRAHHSSQNCCGNLFLSRLPFGLLENEYRHLEAAFKDDGTKYINWAAKMTISTNIGIPWIMSKQTKAPGDVGWKQVWLVYSQGWWPNAFSLAICLCHMSQ
ncbi:hypothetical protein ACJX0J_016443, partial [Zea mays]